MVLIRCQKSLRSTREFRPEAEGPQSSRSAYLDFEDGDGATLPRGLSLFSRIVQLLIDAVADASSAVRLTDATGEAIFHRTPPGSHNPLFPPRKGDRRRRSDKRDTVSCTLGGPFAARLLLRVGGRGSCGISCVAERRSFRDSPQMQRVQAERRQSISTALAAKLTIDVEAKGEYARGALDFAVQVGGTTTGYGCVMLKYLLGGGRISTDAIPSNKAICNSVVCKCLLLQYRNVAAGAGAFRDESQLTCQLTR